MNMTYKEGDSAEVFYMTNYKSKHNPLLKENRKIEQFTFDDLVDFAESYYEARKSTNKENTREKN